MRQVDAAGRRWYTDAFKQRVVADCLRPDASVSKVAVDSGLNPNLVRKWLARVDREDASPAMLPVVGISEPAAATSGAWRHVAEVQVGGAVILIGENASSELVRTIVRALR